jgi:predicted phosphodiesterase
MGEFHKANRLYLIWGNHDIERKDAEIVKRHLHYYENERLRKQEPLLPGIVVHEGLVLRYEPTGHDLFLVHGHQGSWESEFFWRGSRYFVGRFWKPLQVFGLNDPTLPSQNAKQRHKVETKIQRWIGKGKKSQPLICGHTHRSWFPYPGEIPYFNTGSCVHPRFITGIEIQDGTIALIKWWLEPNDSTGELAVTRRTIVDPERLVDYFEIPG